MIFVAATPEHRYFICILTSIEYRFIFTHLYINYLYTSTCVYIYTCASIRASIRTSIHTYIRASTCASTCTCNIIKT